MSHPSISQVLTRPKCSHGGKHLTLQICICKGSPRVLSDLRRGLQKCFLKCKLKVMSLDRQTLTFYSLILSSLLSCPMRQRTAVTEFTANSITSTRSLCFLHIHYLDHNLVSLLHSESAILRLFRYTRIAGGNAHFFKLALVESLPAVS